MLLTRESKFAPALPAQRMLTAALNQWLLQLTLAVALIQWLLLTRHLTASLKSQCLLQTLRKMLQIDRELQVFAALPTAQRTWFLQIP